MDLKSRIVDEMKAAMRQKDSERLETIRMIRAAIQRKELDDRTTLDDAGVLIVLQKMLKQGRDSFKQFTDGGRDDLAAKEQSSITVLETYMPPPLSAEELDTMLNQVMSDTGATSIKDMGKVMGKLKPMVDGRADMGALSGIIRQKLSS